jgi:hypothetical protein
MLHDTFRLCRTASKRGLKPAVRPNGTSDQPKLGWLIAEVFTFVQVYDYTKIPNAWTRTRSNYDITFSYGGNNWEHCVDALSHGLNVTVVFPKGKAFPATYRGYPVIDGDQHDLRFVDPKGGYIVALGAKGRSGKRDTKGAFVVLQ